MSQRIQIVTDVPRDHESLEVTLRCDGDHADHPEHVYCGTGESYIALMRTATRLGWCRQVGGRWLGPCCSKRKAQT